ncbi:MAG: O-antigen ligase family protein [Vicinamibacterales bacterium]
MWLYGLLVTLAWGAGAFGSAYRWAYTPLLISSAVLGLAGLWLGQRSSRSSWLLALCLASIAVAVVAQMVPLPLNQLMALSPHAAQVIGELSLPFELNSTSHSLSIDPSRTRLGLVFLGAFGLFMLGTARVLTRAMANHLAGALVILGVALATVGIVQHATFTGKIYGFWELDQGGAPFGPFVNKNHFAGWMLMALPVTLGYFLALVSRGMEGRKPGFRNLVLWFSTEQASRATLTAFAILVMALSLVLTVSRSGIMGFVVALLLVGTVMARRQSSISRRALVIAYLTFLLVAVVSWVGLDLIAARFAQMDPGSINERPAIWADTLRIARDFWLTGTGLNTYGVSTLFYQTSVPGLHLNEAHNDYLQLAAEGGVLLCLPIACTIGAFAWSVRKRLQDDVGSIWWIRMGAVTGLIAIALQSLVEFSLQKPGNAALFCVLCGLALHDSRRL